MGTNAEGNTSTGRKPVRWYRRGLFRLTTTQTLTDAIAAAASSNSARCDLLVLGGAALGTGVTLEVGVLLSNAGRARESAFANLTLGSNVYIGPSTHVDLKGPLRIGNDVTISSNVVLVTHTDVGKIPLREQFPVTSHGIVIEDNVYIGAGAIVLDGVRIGSGSVVGAGALVNRDVEPGVVVAGVPARVIRRLRDGEQRPPLQGEGAS